MEENEVTYPIPANVSTRFEFFPGIGIPEGIAIGVSLVIGILMFIMIQGVIPVIVSVIIVLAASFVVYTLVKDGLSYSIYTAILGAVVLVLSYFKLPIYVNVFAIIVPVIFVTYYVKKDPITGYSMYEHAKTERKFKKSQKVYLYRREY